MSAKFIKINGHTVAVKSAYGSPVHTYTLTNGAYVYRVGAEWVLHVPNGERRTVKVSAVWSLADLVADVSCFMARFVVPSPAFDSSLEVTVCARF